MNDGRKVFLMVCGPAAALVMLVLLNLGSPGQGTVKSVQVSLPALKPTPAQCVWVDEFETARAALSPIDVTVKFMADNAGSASVEGKVTISPDTPCEDVQAVLAHEKFHVQQLNVYGSFPRAEKALKGLGGVEVMADCGTQLLRGPDRPLYYLQREGIQVCTQAQFDAAREIWSQR